MKRSPPFQSLLLSVLCIFAFAMSGCSDGDAGPPGPPGPPGQNPTTQLPDPDQAERVVFYVDDRGTPDVADDIWRSHYQLGLAETAVDNLPETRDAFARKYRAELVSEDGQVFLLLTNLVNQDNTARHPVDFTYGGERNYKQRYVVSPANHDSRFISPLQFNDQWQNHPDGLTVKWVGYNPQSWFNPANNTLRLPANSAAFDGDCAGCHFTSYSLLRNARGQEVALAGRAELEIDGEARSFVGSTRCLSCHGDMVNWGQTLHKLTLRQPLQFSEPQARGAQLYVDTINRGIKLALGMIDNNNTPETNPSIQTIVPLAITRSDPNGAIDYDRDGQRDEINIGCERCHGPGSEHVRTLDAADIVNPRNLAADQANMVCGQCHNRGLSRDVFTDFLAEATAQDSTARTPFPAIIGPNGEVQQYRLGDDLNDYYVWDAGAQNVAGLEPGRFNGQYWGGEPSGGNFVASRQHHQQYIDMLQGGHAAIRCFDCHEMHDNRAPDGFQIVTTRRGGVNGDGPEIRVNDLDNTLCLSCHAGQGPFAAITLEEVADVWLNGPSGNLMQTVSAHTQHIYNPQGTGETPVVDNPRSNRGNEQASRCSGCHMVFTARTALDWDIRAHTFQIIRPEASLSTSPSAGVPNSCNICHGGTTDEELTVLQQAFADKFLDAQGNFNPAAALNPYFNQWAQSGHANFTAEPFTFRNAAGEIEPACARCHSTSGFVDFAQDGQVQAAVPTGEVISCAACHTQGASPALAADPSTRWDNRDQHTALEPVVFPSGAAVTLNGPSNICMACHQGRASKVQVDAHIAANPADLRFVNIHYYAAAATMFGSEVRGGYEYDGQTYRGRNTFPAHPQQLQVCTGCHMPERNGAADHTFLPQPQDCTSAAGCHTGGEFATLSGSPGANRTAIETLKGELQALLTASGVTLLPNFPYFQNLTNAEQLRAAYNWQVADKDPCGYIHNGPYVQQLLHDSIVAMGGTPSIIPPGRTAPGPGPGPGPGPEPPPGDVAAGQVVYDQQCATCHQLGTYDTSPGIGPDLAGDQVSARFPTPGQPGSGIHAGITLDQTQLTNLQAFVDAQSP